MVDVPALLAMHRLVDAVDYTLQRDARNLYFGNISLKSFRQSTGPLPEQSVFIQEAAEVRLNCPRLMHAINAEARHAPLFRLRQFFVGQAHERFSIVARPRLVLFGLSPELLRLTEPLENLVDA